MSADTQKKTLKGKEKQKMIYKGHITSHLQNHKRDTSNELICLFNLIK